MNIKVLLVLKNIKNFLTKTRIGSAKCLLIRSSLQKTTDTIPTGYTNKTDTHEITSELPPPQNKFQVS